MHIEKISITLKLTLNSKYCNDILQIESPYKTSSLLLSEFEHTALDTSYVHSTLPLYFVAEY